MDAVDMTLTVPANCVTTVRLYSTDAAVARWTHLCGSEVQRGPDGQLSALRSHQNVHNGKWSNRIYNAPDLRCLSVYSTVTYL